MVWLIVYRYIISILVTECMSKLDDSVSKDYHKSNSQSSLSRHNSWRLCITYTRGKKFGACISATFCSGQYLVSLFGRAVTDIPESPWLSPMNIVNIVLNNLIPQHPELMYISPNVSLNLSPPSTNLIKVTTLCTVPLCSHEPRSTLNLRTTIYTFSKQE